MQSRCPHPFTAAWIPGVFLLALLGLSGIPFDKFFAPHRQALIESVLSLVPCILLLVYGKTLMVSASENRLGWVVILFILGSALWSLLPLGTFEVWRRIALGFALGVVLAYRFGPQALLRLLAVAFGFLVAASSALAVFAPWLGKDNFKFPDNWIGLYYSNEYLALYLNLALATFMALWHAERRQWVRFGVVLPMTALTLMAIIGCDSATGLVSAAVVMGMGILLFLLRQCEVVGMFAVAAVTLTALCASYQMDMLTVLGKDETLTGRTEIWHHFMQASKARPWLGYGGQNVFMHDDTKVLTSSSYSERRIPYAPRPHSLYIAVLVKYGYVGSALMLAFFARMCRRAFSTNRQDAHAMASWPMLALTVIVVFGVTMNIDDLAMIWLVCGIIMHMPIGIAIAASRPMMTGHDHS